jgi:hypothetical protein
MIQAGYIAHSDAVADEDRLSSVALKKALAFFVYSLLSLAGVEFVLVVTNLYDLPDFRTWLRLGMWLPAESAILFGTLLGVLPGTRSTGVRGFSDKQFVLGITALSLVPLVLGFGVLGTEVFNWVMNGFLVAGVVLFFVIKSAVTGRLRLMVLTGLVLPLLQIWFSGYAPPPGG